MLELKTSYMKTHVTGVEMLQTFLLRTVETVAIKARLTLTLEGAQSINTSGIDVTWRRAALVHI